MTVEQEAKGTFSPEDASNVLIPCCLSATTFEIYDSFKQILYMPPPKKVRVATPAKPQKIKLFAVLKRFA